MQINREKEADLPNVFTQFFNAESREIKELNEAISSFKHDLPTILTGCFHSQNLNERKSKTFIFISSFFDF